MRKARVEAIGTCGHTYGACTCDSFEYDPEATRAVEEDLYQRWLHMAEEEAKDRRRGVR